MTDILRVALLAAGALTASLPAQKETPIVDTTLEALRSAPDAFKNVRVRVPVQFCSVGRVANPFFTQFVPSDFANFIVWSVSQPIWRREAYEDMFGLMFVSKLNAEGLRDLYSLELYDRVNVVGTVRNVFQGEPWLEIDSFERLDGRVETASLTHLHRGETHMDRREWRQAITELSMAPASQTPDEVLSAVARNLGVCYLRLGEVKQAVANLERAVDLTPEDRDTGRLLAQVRQRPDIGLDRAVDTSQVRDHERPLWEAFENEDPTATPIR